MLKTSDIILMSVAGLGLLVIFYRDKLFSESSQNKTVKFLYDNNKIVGGALVLAAGYFLFSGIANKKIQIGGANTGSLSMSGDSDLTSKDLTLDLSSLSSSIGSELGSSVSSIKLIE